MSIPTPRARSATPGAACAVVLAAALLLGGCGGAQSRFDSHMRRGESYFSQGEFLKASVEFRNAMQIAPTDPRARVLAGHTAEHLGHFQVAVGLYQSVVDSNPDNVDARASLARLFVLAGAAQRGLEVIRPALSQHPDDVELLVTQAAAKIALDDAAGARADAERALQLAPTNEDVVAVRAGLYRRSGDLDAAIALVAGAVKQLPSNTALRELLASLYTASAKPGQAEEQLRELTRLKPKELRYRGELARFYAQAQRPEEARSVLEQAIRDFPDDDTPKLALVDFVSRQRSASEAEQVLRGFIARAPDDYDLQLQLGTLLENSGKPQQALAAYQELIHRAGNDPKGIVARDRIAAIDLRDGRPEQALKLIAEVLQANPRDPAALGLRGQIELDRHDPVAAIADFRAVLRDQPRAVPLQRLLARAHLANGEPALAEEALRTALEVMPGDSTSTVELARLLVQSRRTDEAIALLEQAVRKAPEPPLREELVRAYLANRDFAKARSLADELATSYPDRATPHYLNGMAAQGEGKLEVAQKEYERALALQPQALEVLSALARLELAQGRGERAVELVKSAAARDATNAYVWNLLGELYLARQNAAQATDAFTRASRITPHWWVPERNLALVSAAANDVAGAISHYDVAIGLAPSEPALVIELAELCEKHGRVDEAIARYDAWHRKNPRDQLAANNLAMLLVTYRSDRASLDRARALTQGFDSSTEAAFLDTDGWVHFKRAEYADALPALERAAERAPGSPVIHYHLGMAELQAGRTERARAELQTAVSGSASFQGADEARITLASLKSRTG
jgi:tetratricopeptide (TPR) repeat protein